MGFGVMAGRFYERSGGVLPASEASFVFETGEHHLPAFVYLADAPLVADADIVVKGGVGALGANCPNGLYFYARRGERHDEHREAAMLGGFGIGAGEKDHKIGFVRHRRPHLLAVDDPLVAVLFGFGATGCHIRASFGFAVAERDQRLAVEQLGDDFSLEEIIAQLQDDRGHQHDVADAVYGRACQLQLFGENRHLHRAAPAAAELFGDGTPQPASVGHLAVELPVVESAVAGEFFHLWGDMLGAELLKLGAELLFGGG